MSGAPLVTARCSGACGAEVATLHQANRGGYLTLRRIVRQRTFGAEHESTHLTRVNFFTMELDSTIPDPRVHIVEFDAVDPRTWDVECPECGGRGRLNTHRLPSLLDRARRRPSVLPVECR